MLNSVDKTKLKNSSPTISLKTTNVKLVALEEKSYMRALQHSVTQREACKMPPLRNQWHPWPCFLLSIVSAVGKCTFLIKSKLMLLWYFTLSFSLQHFLTLLNDGWLSLMGERQKKRERHIPLYPSRSLIKSMPEPQPRTNQNMPPFRICAWFGWKLEIVHLVPESGLEELVKP